jgi:hypothetical protein
MPRVAVWESLTNEEMLNHIPRVAAHIDQAETDLRSWVQELRRRGVTWTRIGEALGVTRQSAWERFSGESEPALRCERGDVGGYGDVAGQSGIGLGRPADRLDGHDPGPQAELGVRAVAVAGRPFGDLHRRLVQR